MEQLAQSESVAVDAVPVIDMVPVPEDVFSSVVVVPSNSDEKQSAAVV